MSDVTELIARANRVVERVGVRQSTMLIAELADALEELDRENTALAATLKTVNDENGALKHHLDYDEVVFGDDDDSPAVYAKRWVGPWVEVTS